MYIKQNVMDVIFHLVIVKLVRIIIIYQEYHALKIVQVRHLK
jgi:hypothetical protein